MCCYSPEPCKVVGIEIGSQRKVEISLVFQLKKRMHIIVLSYKTCSHVIDKYRENEPIFISFNFYDKIFCMKT